MAGKYKEVIADKKKQAERLMNENQIIKCNAAIHSAATASAVAGFTPIPVADAIPITAAQITMVVVLGKIFGVKVTESVAKGLIGAAASTFVGRNLVKLIPVIGWGVSAVVAAGVTEAIGWMIAVDFAQEAKIRWEEEHNFTERIFQSDFDSEIQTESSNDEERNADGPTDFVDDLIAKSEAFISGEKKRSDHEDDFQELIIDIEKILDSLPLNHQLRKKYDDLCCIID